MDELSQYGNITYKRIYGDWTSTLHASWKEELLANSITLTPGTITVSVEDDRFCVHCLDKELAEGMEDSVFVKLLEEMEEVEARWTR